MSGGLLAWLEVIEKERCKFICHFFQVGLAAPRFMVGVEVSTYHEVVVPVDQSADFFF